MKYIDDWLNSITMYRLIMYGLMVLAAITIIFGYLHLISFSGTQLLISVSILISLCWLVNELIGYILKAPHNDESSVITGLILFFLLTPPSNLNDGLTLVLAAILAMASKYIFALGKKHLFNPAAAAAVILGLIGNPSVIWWVGTPNLLLFTLILGLLIIRKIRRFSLFFAFLFAALVTINIYGLTLNRGIIEMTSEVFLSWPLIFFGTVMLTEPSTTPPTRKLQIIYGLLIGVLFGAQFRFGPVYSTPELVLLLGNLFSYLVGSKQRLKLILDGQRDLGADVHEFAFVPNQQLNFSPGQYLEWTLPSHTTDDRGNRRYFTVASSPTEKEIRLGVKVSPQHSSTFKQALIKMQKGEVIYAAQLAGDFILPSDRTKKLVFIAGGIGVTPFRSMIKYLLDKNQRRDIVLFYSSATANGFAFQEIFEQATKKIGLKVIYVLTDKNRAPKDWQGELGRLTPEIITKHISDYQQRTFYLSGPEAMVQGYKKLLLRMGVSRRNIVTDYFPGY